MDDYMCDNCVTPWKCNGPHAMPDEFAAYAALALEWADLTLGVARRRLPSWASED